MKMKLLVSLLAAGMAMNANAALENIGSEDFIWTGVVPVMDGDGGLDKGEYVITPTIAGVDLDEGKLTFTNSADEIKLTDASKIGFKVQAKSIIEGKETFTDVAYTYTLQKNYFSTTEVSDKGASDSYVIDDGYFDVVAAQEDNSGNLINRKTLVVGNQSGTIAAETATILTVEQSDAINLNKVLKAGQVVQVKSTLLIAADNTL